MPPLTKSKNKAIIWSAIGLIIPLTIGGGIFKNQQLDRFCPNKNEKRVWNSCYKNLAVAPLVIGIASPPKTEDYSVLAAYLEKELNLKVKIERDTPYQQDTQRIASKDWDIAFTRSPIFSIVAEDNKYLGIALMYPDRPPFYRSALYVRADSKIQSIADINQTTTIALGSPESAPTFHLPIYTLYGKSLRIGTGYSPTDSRQLVKSGKVDIASSRYDVVKADPQLRIIHISKTIPSAGVYLSPKLSEDDRKRIVAALLNAPVAIRSKSNYGATKIPDYDELRKIIFRTETILSCPGLNLNYRSFDKTINVFCQVSTQQKNVIQGQVTEYTASTPDDIEFKIVTPAKEIYRVIVSRQTLNQIPINPVDAVDETVKIKNVAPKKIADGNWQVIITKPDQLVLVNDSNLD